MDYSKLGLKVGLEIHQQINSKHKLFCNCPVQANRSSTYGQVQRKLRAVAGELGNYDPAALYEFLKGKTFLYRNNYDTSCLVELDESPPHEINKEALEETIKACKLLNCKIVDEVHVMRKTVIDGSAVSGFQRTSIIGYNGFLKTSFGKVGIQTVFLEEDSSTLKEKEYKLDRLGTPLIEVATDVVKTPEQAKEVAENIGQLLRSLKVVRGIGSIRQDINISIKNGERIEIKGFQELDKIPDLVKTEVNRQLSLLEIKKELHKRDLKKINAKPEDVTDFFKNTKYDFLKNKKREKIFAIVLPEFGGLLEKKCGDRTFGKELSGYAVTYGYGIIHSDELRDFSMLKNKLHARARDLVLIIIGENPTNAINAVLKRAKNCLIGVPKETRVADNEGSKFTRPLPGSNRMYPETDVPPVKIKNLISIKTPKTLFQREKDLSKKISGDLAKQIVSSEYFSLFDEFTKNTKVDPTLIANMFLSFYKDLKREGHDLNKINNFELLEVLKLIESEKIDKKALYDSLKILLQNKTAKDVEKKFQLMDENDLRKIISSAIEKNPNKNEKALMGIIMSQVKGRASGGKISKLLKNLNN